MSRNAERTSVRLWASNQAVSFRSRTAAMPRSRSAIKRSCTAGGKYTLDTLGSPRSRASMNSICPPRLTGNRSRSRAEAESTNLIPASAAWPRS